MWEQHFGVKNRTCEGPEIERNVVNSRDFKEVGVAGAWEASESIRREAGEGRCWVTKSHVEALRLHTSGVTVGVPLNLPAVRERAIERM